MYGTGRISDCQQGLLFEAEVMVHTRKELESWIQIRKEVKGLRYVLAKRAQRVKDSSKKIELRVPERWGLSK